MKHSDRFFKGKPKLNSKSKYNQGFFTPTNPEKYSGNLESLIYRSGLELKWFKYFDVHPSIIQWKCEEVVIYYHNPVDNRMHKYFIDVWIKYKDKQDKIHECLIEIKPFQQVQRPKKNNRKTKSYCYAVNNYIVNESKWNAAKKIAVERGADFKILTETGFVEWNITK